MLPTSRSRRRAGTLGRQTPTKIENENLLESQESFQYRPSGLHGRVRGALMRAQRVLAAYADLSLPQVSISALARAVSAFLKESRLGAIRAEDPNGRVSRGSAAASSGGSIFRQSSTRGGAYGKYRRGERSRRNPEVKSRR